jgi:hypothetical protein
MPCPLSDIFDMRYGHSLELNALEISNPKDGVAFVSRQRGHNGISAYVTPIPDIDPAPAGDISCALGGEILTTFIQEAEFYCGRDVAILRPKVKMSKQQVLFYCLCIKTNRYRYSYGRQANRTLSTLQIPALDEIPKWVAAFDLNKLNGVDDAMAKTPTPNLDPTKWVSFKYDYLFDIERGKGPRKLSLNGEGETPFITAIDSNNGLTGFTVEPPQHDGNVISVNRNGNGVAEAFYQPRPFSSTEDVHIFKPRFQLNKQIAMFLIPLIRQERYRFNYARKWGLERMNESKIRLPVTSSGEPDWQFMENYINSLPYSKSI